VKFQDIDKQVVRGYNMTVNTYNKSDDIIVTKNCFAFMFTNIGDTTARINGMVIFPSTTPGSSLGDSRSISGHLLDVYAGVMRLSFDTPAGAAPLVEIVQLFYI
jgi:hypothetical protein